MVWRCPAAVVLLRFRPRKSFRPDSPIRFSLLGPLKLGGQRAWPGRLLFCRGAVPPYQGALVRSKPTFWVHAVQHVQGCGRRGGGVAQGHG